ncbi:MAG: 4-phosphoerythronate dehydrogenase, partial [Muribaculaceae bacterium]|nr:4-phosphoerythronate dehydrogenase [Muribaculaceae bacterium]
CKFVATATIGMDHIDRDWAARAGLTAVNAPGCNAPAVAQYVFASLARLINRPVGQYTIAIVGVGNVGRIVERWARALDMRVMRVDPLRQKAEGGADWSTLEDAAREADIITFHTPLTRGGEHPTFHLADRDFFRSLKRAPIVINSSRGPVVDNEAWLEAIGQGLVSHSVIDVWEGEPSLNLRLLEKADIATPHIAGYSRDGKVRATSMVLDEISKHFGLPSLKPDCTEAQPIAETISVRSVMESYNPLDDTRELRANPARFEQLRDSYDLRQEAPAAKVD